MTTSLEKKLRRALFQCLVVLSFLVLSNAKALAGEDPVCSNGFVNSTTTVCGSGTSTITIFGANSTYKLWANATPQWNETPLAQATAQSGNGTAYLVTPSISTNTTYYVSRVHDSGGCESTRMAVNITVKETPQVFSYSGAGTYCSDAPAIITLNKSQTGVTYSLYKSNGTLVSSQPGVGDGTTQNPGPLQFPVTEADVNYHIKGKRDGCSQEVNMFYHASLNIAFVDPPAPLPVEIDGGATEFCGPFSAVIRLKNAVSGYRYELFDQNGAGTSFGTEDGAGFDRTWTVTNPGVYKIKGWRIDGNCTQVVDMQNTISVTYTPDPVNKNVSNSNPGTLCEGETTRLAVVSPEANTKYKLFNQDGSTVSFATQEKEGAAAYWDFSYVDDGNGYSSTSGHYVIKAKKNGCTDWFTMNSGQSITVTFEQQPDAKTFSGGGLYCDTGPSAGTTISVNSPQASIWYHLYHDHGGGSLTYVESKRTLNGFDGVDFTVRTHGNYAIKSGLYQDPTQSCLTDLTPSGFTSVNSVAPPAQKNTNVVNDNCWTGTIRVELEQSESGVSYELLKRVSANNYTSVSSQNGNGGTIHWNFTFADADNDGISDNNGDYVIDATRNGCSTVRMAQEPNVSFERKPDTQVFEGGGSYCDSDAQAGAEVRLLNSETGIWYHLYSPSGVLIESKPGADNQQVVWNGTSVRESGAYTVKASLTQTVNGNTCLTNMTASPTNWSNVSVVAPPAAKTVTVNNSGDFCWNETATLTVQSPENDVTYQLYKNGSLMGGKPNRPGYAGPVTWDLTIADGNGSYSVYGTRTGCAAAPMNNAVSIDFEPEPLQFAVTGGGVYCEGESTIIRLEDSQDQMIYNLVLNGVVEDSWTGDGDAYDFTVTKEGSYTVVAAVAGCPDVTMTNNTSTPVEEIILAAPAVTSYYGCSGDLFNLSVLDYDPNNGTIQTYHWYDEADDVNPMAVGSDFAVTLQGEGSGAFLVAAVSHSGCEGPRALVWTHVTAKPAAPFALNQERCGPGEVVLGVASPRIEYEYVWYTIGDQELSRGPVFTTPSLTVSTGYKVVAYANGCASDPVTVTAIINNVAAPAQPEVFNDCAKQYLRVLGTPPAGVEWYWQGVNAEGTNKEHSAERDYLATSAGTYYLRAFDPVLNCWSAAVSTTVTEATANRIVPDGCEKVDIDLGDLANPSPAYPTADRYNYIKTFTPREAGVTITAIEDEASPMSKEQLGLVTEYFDGLGRSQQVVQKMASSSGKDFVQPIEYDEFGRSVKHYSPYTSDQNSGGFVLNPFQEQKSKLSQHFPEDDIFFGITQFENSPLQRVVKKMAAGNAWAGSGIGTNTKYLTNTSADDVKIWRVDEQGVPYTDGAYAEHRLQVISSENEEGIFTLEYRDNSGKLILKKTQELELPGSGHFGWSSTYYIYDIKGQLLYIVPPNAVSVLNGANWVWNVSDMMPLVYHYTRDGRGRQITKQVPGGSRVDMVYDKLDRLVATQDGNQRSGINKPVNWSFNKFDAHDRPVMNGIFYTGKDRSTLQIEAEDGTFSTNVVETIPASPGITEAVYLRVSEHRPGVETYRARQGIEFLTGFDSGTDEFDTEVTENLSIENHEGYNDGTFPASPDQLEIHEIIYYDDYRFTNKAFYTGYAPFEQLPNAIDPVQHTQADGLRTGSRVRVLGTDEWMENVYYYDNNHRLIQQRLDNRNGGEKIETRQYDFQGKKLQVDTRTTNPMAQDVVEVNLRKKYSYDHQGRLAKVEQDLNNSGIFKTVGTYAYDPMGKMGQRVLGDELETLNYTYNVRGMIRGINGEEVKKDGIMEDHFFAMSLSYGHGFSQVQKDGLVSGQIWKTKSDPTIRAFGYAYDPLNRLIKADYSQKEDDGSWGINIADFSVDNLTYDHAGNITSLRRQGLIGGMKNEIDALTYTYKPGSLNQLLRVEDATGKDEGFKTINSNEDDFVYDENGNMITDANKDIAYIEYNNLNLPAKVVMHTDAGVHKNVTYYYDGLGKKLSEVTDDNGEITTIDYVAGLTYENGELKSFSHDEGRIRNTSKGFVYDYYIKDHLGNNRITLTEDRKISTYLASMETEYDPVAAIYVDDYEEQLFINLDATRVVSNNANVTYDHNFTANKAARLNGSDPARRVGPAKMLAVSTGDIVDLQAFAYYEGTAQPGNPLAIADMLGALAFGFGGLNGGSIEQQYMYDQLGTANANLLAGSTLYDNTQPRAYLNFLLFDENFTYYDAGYVQVNAEAANELGTAMQDRKIQELALQRSITKNGYMFIYVSNESDANFEVFFDDLRITHTQGTILSEDQYYPYGLKIQGLTFDAPKIEGIAGGDKFGLGMNDLGFRSYDPKIARFYATDPLGENSAHLSPYHYAKDNPVSNFDAFGLQPQGADSDNPNDKKDEDDELEWLRVFQAYYNVKLSLEQSANGGGYNDLVVTVTGQRVPQEFRQLSWKEITLQIQADIIKGEQAAEDLAESLRKEDQERNRPEGILGSVVPNVTSSTGPGATGNTANSGSPGNNHLTNTQKAAEKDKNTGTDEKSRFERSVENSKSMPKNQNLAQDAMNSNQKGNGNFNNENDDDTSEGLWPTVWEFVFVAGQQGSKVTSRDQNGDDVDDVVDQETGDFESRPKHNGVKYKAKWYLRPVAGTFRVDIDFVGNDWTEEEKRELEETVAANVEADMDEKVEEEYEALNDPDQRADAIIRLNALFHLSIKKHANRMREKDGAFGLKFRAQELKKENITEEDKEKIEEISEELDKVAQLGLVPYYDHLLFDDPDSDYWHFHDLGFWGFSYEEYLEFLRRMNSIYEAQVERIDKLEDSETMVLFIRLLPMTKLRPLPLDKKIKVLKLISEDGFLTSNPGSSDSNGDDDLDDDDNNPIRDLTRIEVLFPDEKETGNRITEAMSPEEYDDFMEETRKPENEGLLKDLWESYSAWGGPNAFAKWMMSQIQKATTNFTKARNPSGELTFEERKAFHEELQAQGKTIPWDGNTKVETESEMLSNGKLKLKVTQKIYGSVPCPGAIGAGNCTGVIGEEVIFDDEVNPEDPIQIISKLEDPRIGLRRGKDIVPAMTFHYLNRRDANKDINNYIAIGFNVVGIAVGLPALSNGVRSVGGVLALLDVAFSTADIIVIANEDAIRSTYGEEGDNFVESFNTISTIFSLADIATNASKLADIKLEDLNNVTSFLTKNGKNADVVENVKSVKPGTGAAEGGEKSMDEIVETLKSAQKESVKSEFTDNDIKDFVEKTKNDTDAFIEPGPEGGDVVATIKQFNADGSEANLAELRKTAGGQEEIVITSPNVNNAIDQMDQASRTKLVEDLKADPDLLVAMHKNPSLTDSWEVLSDFNSDLRKVGNVEAIGAYTSANNVNHSLIKSELEALDTHKQDFINGLKVSNGDLTPSPLKLDESLDLSTDGSLHGTFVNGQYVPEPNAPSEGLFDFVILNDGQIKVGDKHSWLSNGATEVVAAGELNIVNGSITQVTNASGHYVPTVGDGMNYLRTLDGYGLDISGATLTINKFSNIFGFRTFREITPNSANRALYE